MAEKISPAHKLPPPSDVPRLAIPTGPGLREGTVKRALTHLAQRLSGGSDADGDRVKRDA